MENGKLVGERGDAETAGEGVRGLVWGFCEGFSPALSKYTFLVLQAARGGAGAGVRAR